MVQDSFNDPNTRTADLPLSPAPTPYGSNWPVQDSNNPNLHTPDQRLSPAAAPSTGAVQTVPAQRPFAPAVPALLYAGLLHNPKYSTDPRDGSLKVSGSLFVGKEALKEFSLTGATAKITTVPTLALAPGEKPLPGAEAEVFVEVTIPKGAVAGAAVERRHGAVDTRPLPHAERRHGAPDTRVRQPLAGSAVAPRSPVPPPAPPTPLVKK